MAPLPPVWQTVANLGTVIKNHPVSIALLATDPNRNIADYAVIAGALPSGVTLDPDTGLLAGTAPTLLQSYGFTVRVTDSRGLFADRTFTLEVIDDNVAPVWQTAAGSLGTYGIGTTVDLLLVATDLNDNITTYSVVSGTLPVGLTLNATTGQLSGTIASPAVIPTTSSFTVRVTDSGGLFSDRIFSLTAANSPPTWVTAAGSLGTWVEGRSISVTLQAEDPDNNIESYTVVSGSLPDGLSLNPYSAVISGVAANVDQNTTSVFTIRVADSLGNQNDREFSITITAYVPTVQWITPAGEIAQADTGNEFLSVLEAQKV
jgi:hypothetical protein